MKTVRKAQKLRRFAAAGAETFSGVSRWYDNDARWRIFNVRAWARSKCAVLVLFFLCNVEHSPGVPGVVGTYQSKAQAIESGRGLRRSYQPVVGLEGVPSEASDKVAKQPLRSTT